VRPEWLARVTKEEGDPPRVAGTEAVFREGVGGHLLWLKNRAQGDDAAKSFFWNR